MDDEALVTRARSGDMAAVSELLERHQDAVYTAALRLVGSADAEDIAQEALVRAYTQLPELRDQASFGGWVKRIAVNLSLNALRRRGLLEFDSLDRSHRDGKDRSTNDLPDMDPSPEDRVIAAALKDEIDRLILELPIEQRVAVVLRDMYGFDVSEVAKLQRCGISAAKMRISRGREQLRRRITELRSQQRATDGDAAPLPRSLYVGNE